MKPLSTAASLLVVAAAIAAVCELDSALVLGLFLTAAIGWLAGHVWQLADQDNRYLAFVEAQRLPGDPPTQTALVHSRMRVFRSGALALISVLGLGGLAVWLNSPLPVFGGLSLVLAGTAIHVHGRRYLGRDAWREFAAVTDGLDHDGGDLLNHWQPEHLQGQYRQRSIRLSPIQRSSTNSSARLAVTAEMHGQAAEICWDLNPSKHSERLEGSQFYDEDLAARLAAAAPTRITVSEGRLSLYTPRLPETAAELRFFCELICDLAEALDD